MFCEGEIWGHHYTCSGAYSYDSDYESSFEIAIGEGDVSILSSPPEYALGNSVPRASGLGLSAEVSGEWAHSRAHLSLEGNGAVVTARYGYRYSFDGAYAGCPGSGRDFQCFGMAVID
jgi:hypothetical protein